MSDYVGAELLRKTIPYTINAQGTHQTYQSIAKRKKRVLPIEYS